MYVLRLQRFNVYTFVRFSHAKSTVVDDEISRINEKAEIWWNEEGDLKLIHRMTNIRVKFVCEGLVNSGRIRAEQLQSTKPLSSIKILNVGCGGGILSEALARLGAEVTGLDATQSLISVAKHHASLDHHLSSKINYIFGTIEEHSCSNAEVYDGIVASEVIEHISEKGFFLESCVHALKPGGSVFITTLNKTYTSHFLGNVLYEIILKLIPRNTHDWELFITPQELETILKSCGCITMRIKGLFYSILAKKWSWTKSTRGFYALHAVKECDF